MMLVTCTLLPPTWAAVLPQKFSAATTSTCECELPPVPVPQATPASTATAMSKRRTITWDSLSPAFVGTAGAYHWCNMLVQLVGVRGRPGGGTIGVVTP